jgi:hypothetical protein
MLEKDKPSLPGKNKDEIAQYIPEALQVDVSK